MLSTNNRGYKWVSQHSASWLSLPRWKYKRVIPTNRVKWAAKMKGKDTLDFMK